MAGLLVLGGTTARATTYDIVSQFGASVFSYGSLSGDAFTAFVHEPSYGRCHDHPEWDCFGGTEDYHHVAHTYGNVVPGTILLHPGPVSNVVLRFTAPDAGVWSFDGTGTLLSYGVGYPSDGTTTLFHSSTAPGVFAFAGDTSTPQQTAPLHTTYTLARGDSIDIVVDKNANYYYDDTLFNGSFSGGVPEPATWALMLAGFGLAGAGLRRRKLKLETI